MFKDTFYVCLFMLTNISSKNNRNKCGVIIIKKNISKLHFLLQMKFITLLFRNPN